MTGVKTETQAEVREAPAAVTLQQVEALNMNRIRVMCVGEFAIEAVNAANPAFWQRPDMWPGAVYGILLSISFLVILQADRHRHFLHRYSLFNNTFWVLLVIGFVPFLANDAASSDRPLNSAVLGVALICGPILKTDDLNLVFAVSLAANLAAPALAGRAFGVYYLAVGVITVGCYLLARNLHGRYFRLLEDQKRQYEAYLKVQLAQKELRVQLAHEQDANAAKSRFLSLMSHDLRTPLCAVIGLAELAKDPALTREQRDRDLDEIRRSGGYLLGIINDVLDMSRIENSKMTLHPEPYSFVEFCTTLRDVIDILCTEKNQHFIITAPPQADGCTLLADKTRFNQIFLNLLTNSVKYTPAGGRIELQIELLGQESGRDRWRFTVRDDGIGMSAEFLQHAFEPFRQERENDHQPGTGLGLPIVKNLVELMGGTIELHSVQGTGTDAVVTLALPETDAAALPPAPSCAGALAGRHILLCEDNAINAEIIARILARAGAQTDCAANGSEGVSRFVHAGENAYDAILMDMRMPVMDGLAAARAIRSLARPDAAAVPIIALTANAFAEDRERCLAAGMNDYLTKPVDAAQLIQVLCSCICAKAE